MATVQAAVGGVVMQTDPPTLDIDPTGDRQSPALVSIVIPCFNYGRFLAEAIESALGQTYQPIEVIVVDDGSTDDSSAVAERYPVKLIRQENAGVCVAANRGVQSSHGRYVLRLDADDLLTPTYVEKTVAALVTYPGYDFAYTRVAYFGAGTGSYPVEEFDPESLAERNYIHVSAVMSCRAFDSVGGYNVNMTAVRCEDWDLWLSFAESGFRGVLVDDEVLRYRQHAFASRGVPRFTRMTDLKREWEMAQLLRRNHPSTFRPSLLIRRMLLGIWRVRPRAESVRFALLLTAFCGAMLIGEARDRLDLRVRKWRGHSGCAADPATACSPTRS